MELYGQECVFKYRDRIYYRCEPCDAHVGTHEGDGKPLGTLAKKPLRQLRAKAHKAFDPLWQFGPRWSWRRQRDDAYDWLAEQLRISRVNCHIALFDEETCIKAIALAKAQPDPLFGKYEPKPDYEADGTLQAKVFIGEKCVLGRTLVVPLRVLYKEYEAWCKEKGIRANVYDLKNTLADVPWAKVVGPRGKGLIRTVVEGVGIAPRR